jgi:hypothetical protein
MAGAVAEAGPAQEAAADLAAEPTGHAIAIVAPRVTPMRVTRCRGLDLPFTLDR